MKSAPPTELHIEECGDGDPLLLIHGSFTYDDPSRDDWVKQLSLASRYRLIMPARRGFARSPSRPPGYGFVDETAELAPLLGDGAHLLGFSYGGVLALMIAALRPAAVRSLTLIEPPAFSLVHDDPHVKALVERLATVYPPPPGQTPEEFLLAFRRALRGIPIDAPLELTAADRENLARPSGRRGVEATMLESPSWQAPLSIEPLAAAQVPVLVVSAGWSAALDAVCDALEHRLHGQRAIIKGAGHPAQLTGEPFNERLLAFIDSAAR